MFYFALVYSYFVFFCSVIKFKHDNLSKTLQLLAQKYEVTRTNKAFWSSGFPKKIGLQIKRNIKMRRRERDLRSCEVT